MKHTCWCTNFQLTTPVSTLSCTWTSRCSSSTPSFTRKTLWTSLRRSGSCGSFAKQLQAISMWSTSVSRAVLPAPSWPALHAVFAVKWIEGDTLVVLVGRRPAHSWGSQPHGFAAEQSAKGERTHSCCLRCFFNSYVIQTKGQPRSSYCFLRRKYEPLCYDA